MAPGRQREDQFPLVGDGVCSYKRSYGKFAVVNVGELVELPGFLD